MYSSAFDGGRNRLKEILVKYCLMKREDGFFLATGKPSNVYIDTKMAALHPEGAILIGNLLYEMIKDYQPALVGGPAQAAIPLVTSVAMSSRYFGDNVSAFYSRKDSKGYGAEKKIEGHISPLARAAIVDDVVTTGSSILETVSLAESNGLRVVCVAALVNRFQDGDGELQIANRGYKFLSLFNMTTNGEIF